MVELFNAEFGKKLAVAGSLFSRPGNNVNEETAPGRLLTYGRYGSRVTEYTAYRGCDRQPYAYTLRLERRAAVAQGRHSMKQGTKHEAKGKFHELKGRVKEKVGRATGKPNLEADGQDEKVAGKVQKKIGQVEKVFGE